MASIARLRSTAILLGLCLYFASFVLAQPNLLPLPPPQSPEEAAVRALVERYFEAWQNEDLEAAVGLWSEKSPDFGAGKSRLQNLFSANDRIEVRNLQLRRLAIEGERASALSAIEVSALDVKTGKPAAGLGKMNRALSFAKEAGQWRFWRDTAAEADLASALVAAKNEESRATLLADEKELLTADLWRALLTQGDEPRRQGKYADALSIYVLAQKIAELIEDKAGTAAALRLIGIVHYRQGHYDLSLDHLQRSLKLSEALADEANIADTLVHFGIVYYLRSDYTVALDYYQRSLALYEATGRGDRADGALTGLGVVHYRLGNYDLALDYYRKALALREKAGNRLSVGYALSNIGGVTQVLGNYGLALDYHQKALEVFEAQGAKPDAVVSLTNIGLLYSWQGNYGLALEYYRKAFTLAEAQGQELEVARLLGYLGQSQMAQGQYAQALESYNKSLATATRLGNKLEMIAEISSIGTLYERQGDYAQALEYYQRSLSISKALDVKSKIAGTLASIGHLHNLQGDYTLALESAESAVSIAKLIRSAHTLRDALIVAGTAQLGLGQTEQARRAFEEAIAAVESLRAQVAGDEQAQQQFFEQMVSPYYKMVELLAAIGNVDEALTYAEYGKARVLLDVLRSGRVNVTKVMTAREREQERGLSAALVSLNTQISSEERRPQPDQVRLANLKAQLEKARLEHEDFQTRLYAAHPDLRVQRGEARPFSSEQANELLAGPETALLEYVVTDKTAYLFVLTASANAVTPTGPQQPILKLYDLKLGRKELNGRVQTFRQRIANNDLGYAAPSADLYDLLIRPAEGQLQGKTRLVIVPDDVLWETPFQALRPAGGKYLIQTAAISYAPSLTVLREMTRSKRNRAPGGTLLAMGNPRPAPQTVSRSKNLLMSVSLEPLPEAERMVKSLTRIYGAAASRVYVGASASEGVLKAEAGKHRVLHLAAHGVLNDASPMYSHVVLSQGEGDREDGLLEAWEVMNLDLHADLVVLSACETARGRFGAGEGVIGMTWALFVAGIPTSVVSQWRVESVSTTELMIEFYRRLKGGVGKSEAMRGAAVKLIADRRYEHPFYWAGFIVVGDGK
ncbi:MAG: CHAT domain-containing protein [bacterium]